LSSSSTQTSSAGCKSSSAALVKSKGDLRITVRNILQTVAKRSRSEPSVSFGAPEEDRMSIAASEEGLSPDDADNSAEQLPALAAAQAEFEAELVAMLLWAAKDIELEVSKVPSPERSRLDNWFLCAGSEVSTSSTTAPFFPEVHEELTKMLRAPYIARPHLSSFLLTTLDGGAARGLVPANHRHLEES
ncbi:hypothetical protein M9458_021385, partial [Cirrhinus mrigala]